MSARKVWTEAANHAPRGCREFARPDPAGRAPGGTCPPAGASSRGRASPAPTPRSRASASGQALVPGLVTGRPSFAPRRRGRACPRRHARAGSSTALRRAAACKSPPCVGGDLVQAFRHALPQGDGVFARSLAPRFEGQGAIEYFGQYLCHWVLPSARSSGLALLRYQFGFPDACLVQGQDPRHRTGKYARHVLAVIEAKILQDDVPLVDARTR